MHRFFLKLLRRSRLQSDLEAELAHHRDLSLAHGNPVGLGNAMLIRENALDLWRFTFIEDFLRDLAYAIRQMRRNPAFAVTAVLSLALGSGLTTSIFSLLNAVAFRPLPYFDPDRLVWMTQSLKWSNADNTDEITITPDFLEWRRQNHSFVDLAGYNYVTRNLTGLAEPLQVDCAKASASLLTLVGAQPFLGRNFLKQEDYKGHDQAAILSYETWQQQFGGDRQIIGRPIALDGEQFTVIGVLPRSFVFPGPSPVQIITPLAKDENAELQRNPNGPITLVQNVIGRLKPGFTREQAMADLTVIQSNLPQMAFHHPTIIIKMLPLRERLFGNAKTASLLLTGAAGFLLLIASANVSNLLLIRLMQRDRELAIRTVLGGSRRRILSQLLTEGALLGVFGCGAGLLLAFWIRRPLFVLSPYRLAGFENLPFDGRVFLFAILLSFVTTLLFAVVPAFRATEIRMSEAMKAGQASIAGGRSMRLLSIIAAAEIATVFILSTAAGLMLESFWKLRYSGLGFQPDRLVAATLSLSGLRYRERARQLAFIHELVERVEALPGVDSTAITNAGEIPPGEGHATNTFGIEGRPLPVNSRHRPIARQEDVSAGYFGIMQIPVLQGRLFSDSDLDGTTPVAVVNREVARRFFPGESAIGHRIRTGGPWREIVGVVGNVKTSGLAAAPEPTLYFPFGQRDPNEGSLDIGVIVRSGLGAGTIAAEFRQAVHKIDPNQPVATVQSMHYRLSESVSKPRFTAVLLSTFASLAVVLGLIGVYGVMGCRVRSQLRELAVRQALGAQPKEVVTHVLGQGLRIVLPGLCLGLAGSLAISRLLASMLYDTRAHDPMTLLGVTTGVISAALLACLVPALRAARIDPLRTLRQD